MGFCVRTIRHDPDLCADGGLLRGADLTLTADAQALAERIRAQASLEAQQVLARAHGDAAAHVAAAEAAAMARAAGLLQALEQQQAVFLERAQGVLIELSQMIFDRLLAETSDGERIAACVKRVLHEAPGNVANAVLRVHPDDLPHVPPVEWAITPDPVMLRGTCRLEASSGEWHADFTAAVAALQTALGNFNAQTVA